MVWYCESGYNVLLAAWHAADNDAVPFSLLPHHHL